MEMSQEQKIISLSAIGFDRAGLVSRITTQIFQMKGNIIDVEEGCRSGLFSIYLLVDFSASENSTDEIMTVLRSIESETGLSLILGSGEEGQLAKLTEKEKYVVTILGIDQPGIIARVSTFFCNYTINIENCRMIARGKFFAMEMVIDTTEMMVEQSHSHKETVEQMKDELKDLCTQLNQSVVIQSESMFRRVKKLVVFDVESTLIRDTALRDFLERTANEVESMGRQIQFRDSSHPTMQALIDNVQVLRGIPASEFEKSCDVLELNPGTLELIQILKAMGFKIALLSSGFSYLIRRILEAVSVDYAFSNTATVDENGIFTGDLEKPVITSATKEEILEFIMSRENISSDQVIAVGDASALPHFGKTVGLSIAFKPEEMGIKTDGILSSDRITTMLYCLGIPKAELERHLQAELS